MPVKDEILIPPLRDQSFSGDVLPGEDGRWNVGSLAKRWNKLVAKILRVINIEYTGNLKPERGGVVYTGYAFVPLTTPLTHSSFNGDSFSDVGSNTKIENTSWSSTIPGEAKALLIRCACRDSGSAATAGLHFALHGTSAAADPTLVVRPSGKANDDFAEQVGFVPCTDGDLWYQCNASGTTTLDVYLWCFGYCI